MRKFKLGKERMEKRREQQSKKLRMMMESESARKIDKEK